MENQFKILIVDTRTIDNHRGEECDYFHEVVLYPTRKQLSEYKLFFMGIIRSVWHELSKNISVICDTEDFYLPMMENLQEKMKENENINFTLNERK